MIVFAAVAWFGGAYAQETSFDAYGFGHVAQDGDVLDPVRAWRAETQRPMSFGAALAFEYAASPLVRRSWDYADCVWQ